MAPHLGVKKGLKYQWEHCLLGNIIHGSSYDAQRTWQKKNLLKVKSALRALSHDTAEMVSLCGTDPGH